MLLGLEVTGGGDPVILSGLHLALLLSLRQKREPRIQCIEIHTELFQAVEFGAIGPPAPLGLRC